MKPATRFLLSGLVLVLLLTLIAAAGTLWQLGRAAQTRSLQQLQVSSTVERDLQANRLIELQLRADVLAQDPAFVDYVAQSLIPNPQLGGAVDSASISDLLKERRRGYDIAMVLDPQGKPVASSGILLKDHRSIQQDPLVTATMGQLKPQQGLWVDHGQLLWVSVNPLLRGGSLQGVLLVASHVDDAFAIAIGRIARNDIVLLMQPAPGADPAPSTNPDRWVMQALAARLPQVLGTTEAAGEPMVLSDAQHDTTVWVTPLQTSGGAAAMVAIGPYDGELKALLNRKTLSMLAGLAGLGLCFMLLVWLQWWRTWRPLQRMLGVIELASHGDHNLTIRMDGSSIVRRLRDGINRLLHRAD
ncbi:MAG TPA: hypothetical protein VN043_11875 [Rhodanobacter sp.]|nr:hypothetical protein [Rhodanobacter sp.]